MGFSLHDHRAIPFGWPGPTGTRRWTIVGESACFWGGGVGGGVLEPPGHRRTPGHVSNVSAGFAVALPKSPALGFFVGIGEPGYGPTAPTLFCPRLFFPARTPEPLCFFPAFFYLAIPGRQRRWGVSGRLGSGVRYNWPAGPSKSPSVLFRLNQMGGFYPVLFPCANPRVARPKARKPRQSPPATILSCGSRKSLRCAFQFARHEPPCPFPAQAAGNFPF